MQVFFGEKGQDSKQPNGVRRDKQLTPEGILEAGFAMSKAEAVISSGAGPKSASRSVTVCAEQLAVQSLRALQARFENHSDILVIKVSKDETPMRIRGETGAVETTKILNGRCHVRWASDSGSESRIPLMAAELKTATAEGLIEALSRMCPSLRPTQLEAAAPSTKFVVVVDIMDSCSANFRCHKIMCFLAPSVYKSENFI